MVPNSQPTRHSSNSVIKDGNHAPPYCIDMLLRFAAPQPLLPLRRILCTPQNQKPGILPVNARIEPRSRYRSKAGNRTCILIRHPPTHPHLTSRAAAAKSWLGNARRLFSLYWYPIHVSHSNFRINLHGNRFDRFHTRITKSALPPTLYRACGTKPTTRRRRSKTSDGTSSIQISSLSETLSPAVV